jgi:hypothetical protein
MKGWENARRKLKQIFENAGITRCEVCQTDWALGFAHRKKRRHITDEKELMTVALLCNPCHERIEYGGDMFNQITAIIERRFSFK